MLARDKGRVVLVAGAIPGERVLVQFERRTRQVAWARVVDVVEPSPDRREPPCDPACGGSFYAHIRYERQLQLKSDVIADAFRRIGKIGLDQRVTVAPSPEHGYRLRARLHVQAGRAGFLLEGTHVLCAAEPTGQLQPETLATVAATLNAIGPQAAAQVAEIVVAENVASSERVVHLIPREGARLDGFDAVGGGVPGATGVTVASGRGPVTLAGSGTVTDTAAQLLGEREQPPIDPDVVWTRHAASFFQGNRFLIGALLRRVIDAAEGERLVDLYAGVGLFAVAFAALGREVVAVEGDRLSGADLAANAEPFGERLIVLANGVEEVVATLPAAAPDVVILDPPRTGLSAEALAGLVRWRAPRLVYVSCDPPTLARDAGRLFAAGYRLQSLEGFDLFPNTPHVETVAVFDRADRAPA